GNSYSLQGAQKCILPLFPLPPPQDFLTRLVCNLLDEGNALFRDGEWEQAAREFSEGLNVSCYAAGEDIQIPQVLLESLYVNRAAAYHSLDCDRALEGCKESRRALYRKALCLKELGKYKEAYNCTTDCLLITRLDKDVNELAQELAIRLGLKNRKPYVSAKVGNWRLMDPGNQPCQSHANCCNSNSCVVKEGSCNQKGLVNMTGVCFPSRPELLDTGDCKFGEDCTFAYNQLEIDVWTEERKGMLDRSLLFEPASVTLDPVTSIIRLLQEHKGTFMFLCQECYDSKPRIISKRCRVSHTTCSNLDALHAFDANKCLAFVVRTHNVNYRKVRPLSVLCQLDLCHQAIRYGCQRENNCHYAHSIIELKTWRVQRHTGTDTGDVSTHQAHAVETLATISFNLNMKMKFACAQCWRDGLISEPEKALKYCTAKARHPWTKDRRVLLVKSLERSKWVQVRPLPHAKNFPLQYDICTQVLEKRKCNYTGKCTFAHSQEEREMWMYMKNNDLLDMQQIYDMWLTLTAQNRQADGAMFTPPVPEEKYIVMPTDYAEPMSGFHCRLCGKHSNSERQWQQHISTEKHKDRVFSCEGEDEALTWSYRFPGTNFDLCPKLDGGCADGVCCDYAHSPEELREWTERRDFLRQKLAKAREDMLIMPDEFDFGKYNFLLQD
uniref:Zinc finger CCCH-type containing 7B n=1 Tax=Seriola lalandi dorsalis TaxID=1841481 RepID=A0A3B4Y6I1_SERLL